MTHIFCTSPARERIEAAGRAFADRQRVAVLERITAATAAAHAQNIEWRRRVVIAKARERSGRTRRALIANIIREVCKARGLDRQLVCSPLRHFPLAHARHECWWRMQREVHLSTSQIGRHFNRDHTTVLHGIREHQRRMAEGSP